MTVAFLGTGMMGTGFVQCLRERGHTVHVWNRTHARAEPLRQSGASVLERVTDAVRDAERIHLALSDDTAVDAVLAELRGAIKPDAVIIDHTTVSAQGVLARFERMEAQ